MTTEAKHTPTPWEVLEPLPDLHEFEPPFGHRFDNGEWETAGWARLAPNVGDTQANAEFIVLAVNNFEPLLEAAREMESVVGPWISEKSSQRMREAYKNLFAAIQHAEKTR
jgi:hypothetical protein